MTLLKIIRVMLVGLILIAHANSNASDQAAERVLWDKRPIQVHIQHHHERIVHFLEEVRYWIPDQLKHKVSVLSANGVLYIRAQGTFPTTRIRVQGLQSQQLYLLDITANDIPSVNDELIVMTKASTTNKTKQNTPESPPEDWRIRLTRYAAQQLYAPERLLHGDQQIIRVFPGTETPIPLIRGGKITCTPMASWKGGGFTVTAVKIQNTHREPLRLQFKEANENTTLNLSRLMRGSWLTATIQHNTLGVAGQPDDTTTLYLVSERPFVESLNGLPTTQIGEVHHGR